MTVAPGEAPARPPDAVLDDPIWSALTGPQSDLAVRRPRAARFPPDVAPFAAVSDPADPAAWSDLAALAGPGGTIALAGSVTALPAGWEVEQRLPVVQMVDDGVAVDPGRAEPGIVGLGQADLPDLLDLVRRTDPGPFERRTVVLGGFVGIRVDGRLVAMAGLRMRPPGWVEVSAVCTDPAYRGHGLGRRVLDAVVGPIHAEGHRAFLHVLTSNDAAVGLYRSYGFVVRRDVEITVVRAPAAH